jgi:hypothetical protein
MPFLILKLIPWALIPKLEGWAGVYCGVTVIVRIEYLSGLARICRNL